MISKEFSHLEGTFYLSEILMQKSLTTKEVVGLQGYLIDWISMALEAANIYVDTTAQFKDKNFIFEVVKYCREGNISLYRYQSKHQKRIKTYKH